VAGRLQDQLNSAEGLRFFDDYDDSWKHNQIPGWIIGPDAKGTICGYQRKKVGKQVINIIVPKTSTIFP